MSPPEAPPEPPSEPPVPRPSGSPETGPQQLPDQPAGRTGIVVIVLLALVSTAVIVGPRLIGSGSRPHLLDQSVSPAESGQDPGADPGSPSAAPDYEQQVVALVNAARLAAGCADGVSVDARLHEAALQHTRDMAGSHRLSHVGSDGSSPRERITQAGYFGSLTGENIAMGYNTAKAVMAAWMASPEHRANIANCDYQRIGVGYVAHGQWWTETFGGS